MLIQPNDVPAPGCISSCNVIDSDLHGLTLIHYAPQKTIRESGF